MSYHPDVKNVGGPAPVFSPESVSVAGLIGYRYIFGGFMPPLAYELFFRLSDVYFYREGWYPRALSLVYCAYWTRYRPKFPALRWSIIGVELFPYGRLEPKTYIFCRDIVPGDPWPYFRCPWVHYSRNISTTTTPKL